MSASNLAVAKEFLGLLWAGEIDKAMEMTAPDFQFRSPFGDNLDRATLTQMLKGSVGMLAGPFHSDVLGVTVDQGRVAVELTGRVMLTNGREYVNRYHMLFEIESGRVKAWREYCDTKAIEVFQLPPISA